MAFAAIKIFQPLGQALGNRLAGRDRLRSGAETETLGRLAQLETRLAEVEERLDFAERLLASAKEPGGLPKGSGT